MKEKIKGWMATLLKRFGGDWAVEQVEVDVTMDEEKKNVQVDFILSSQYQGTFASTKFMELVDNEIVTATETGRLDSVDSFFVVIRQDKNFVMDEIKDAKEEQNRKRRKAAAAAAGRPADSE